MMNSDLIRHAPAWKLTVIHYVAKALGVLVRIEGLPFGSTRNLTRDETMLAKQCSAAERHV